MRTAAFTIVTLAALAAPALADKVDIPQPAAVAIPTDLGVFGAGGLSIGGTAITGASVDGAAYDPAQDLVWFVGGRQLFVVDLRDPHPAPIVIAKNLPEELGSFEITGMSSASYEIDYAAVFPMFHIGAKGKVDVAAGDGAYEGVDEVSDKHTQRAVKKIKIVGKKWLAAQKDRKAHPVAKNDRAEPPKATLPAGRGQCEDEDMCGGAQWLGDSAYQAVLIEHSCGDACHTACVLYDPKTKKFAPALAPGAWGPLADDASTMSCIGFAVEPGGARYFGDGDPEHHMVCTLGAKLTCTDLGAWRPFAWITPAGK